MKVEVITDNNGLPVSLKIDDRAYKISKDPIYDTYTVWFPENGTNGKRACRTGKTADVICERVKDCIHKHHPKPPQHGKSSQAQYSQALKNQVEMDCKYRGIDFDKLPKETQDKTLSIAQKAYPNL